MAPTERRPVLDPRITWVTMQPHGKGTRYAAGRESRRARRAMLWVALVVAASCDEPAIEKLPLPEPRAPLEEQPPPPPPPPPRVLENVGPPPPVSDFLAAHRHRELPWRVAVVELGPRGRVVRLSPDRAQALVERLARSSSWTGGFTGCVSDHPSELRIDGGREPLVLWTSCSNVSVGGPPRDELEACFSDEMSAWLAALYDDLGVEAM